MTAITKGPKWPLCPYGNDEEMEQRDLDAIVDEITDNFRCDLERIMKDQRRRQGWATSAPPHAGRAKP